ncbi:MAG: S8 family serine peptidase [Streptococcus sp.]|uniref:S8 family serine peptidase n=1 Tax=Streptococcus sp. TaxID=1306 RepID=UPI003993D227
MNIYRVFGDSLADPKWINRAIRKAADDGNKVISLSMGQYLLISGSYDDGTNDMETYVIYKNAIDYASEKGSIVVASLGNEGLNEQDNSQMLHYLSSFHHVKEAGIVVDAPCIFDQVVAVGGLDMYGNISDFSNFTDKAIYAPAGSTINLKKYGPTEFVNKGFYLKDWIFTTSSTGWYQYVYGNSFAAPKVASAIALIADKYHITSPEQLKQFLFKNSPTINGNKVLKLTDLLNVGNADMFLHMSIENSISNFNIYSKSSIDHSKITLQLKDVPKQLSYIITDTSIDHLNNKMLPPMGEKVGSDILLIGFLMIDLSALLICNNLIIKYNSDKEVESA